jgi:hypothetical protein
MAFLHYRDAAFQIARAGQVPGQNPAWDMLLSFASSSEDPISGGRHKVLGSRALMIPPQTSTIASHLPKAVGAAYSTRLPAPDFLGPDRLDCASFCAAHFACRGNCQPSWARDRRAACRAALAPLGPWGQ